jgi:hypothetical protein
LKATGWIGGACLMFLASLTACKPGGGDRAGFALRTPERVGGQGDAAPALKVGVLGKGGGSRMWIDLQKEPDSHETAALWSCWAVPADDFALGRAVCREDKQKSVEITASNVDFSCVSNPDFGEVKAKRALSLDFCASYDVYSYQFKPAFNIHIGD